MCGIFGAVFPRPGDVAPRACEAMAAVLFRLSESRGKEAAGIAVRRPASIDVLKQAGPASLLLRTEPYRALLRAVSDDSARGEGPLAFIGHSRLVTNGLQALENNNQPVAAEGCVGVHNGIVVNDAALWARHPEIVRRSEVDTEVLLALVGRYRREADLTVATRRAFAEIEGAASVAVLFEDEDELLLATNVGSLYVAVDAARLFALFASERYILGAAMQSRVFRKHVGTAAVVEHVEAGRALRFSLMDLARDAFALAAPARAVKVAGGGIVAPSGSSGGQRRRSPVPIVRHTRHPDSLRRCERCVLPESFPFIEFDASGVCNYCHNHKKWRLQGREALERAVAPYRSKDGSPDCIVAFSGGRDSSYGLHYIKTELGMHPVAFTYDWGMVTDIARRNTARMTAKLGVEHILRSADIPKKRAYIRMNVQAWLKKPDLGIIPLFMAGDKLFFHYARRLRRETGIELVIFCAGNEYERTSFKTGFCGIRENDNKGIMTRLALGNKLRLAWYYGRQYLTNPAYLNASISDTLRAYWSMYGAKDDFLYLYQYIEWNEDEIDRVLRQRYDWETSPDSESTWRIGDGTAAFYNYIYYTVAGFSEHDTFRSNQVREGVLTRDEALRLVRRDNRPRLEAIREYAQLVGFNCEEALTRINAIPKRY